MVCRHIVGSCLLVTEMQCLPKTLPRFHLALWQGYKPPDERFNPASQHNIWIECCCHQRQMAQLMLPPIIIEPQYNVIDGCVAVAIRHGGEEVVYRRVETDVVGGVGWEGYAHASHVIIQRNLLKVCDDPPGGACERQEKQHFSVI